MRNRSSLSRERLDGTVVDIEFLLIAVIQGLALTTLAVESENVIGGGEWVYLPYLLAGFVLILNFWSLAVIHSISFISWPFDLVHTLLYLFVAFIEVAAFAQVTRPVLWFALMFAFFVVSYALYAWDAKMIRERREAFADTPARAQLYEHIAARQQMELRLLLPGALVFHGLIVVLLIAEPDWILGGDRHVIVVSLQLVSGIGYLADIVRNYRERQRLITAVADEDEANPD